MSQNRILPFILAARSSSINLKLNIQQGTTNSNVMLIYNVITNKKTDPIGPVLIKCHIHLEVQSTTEADRVDFGGTIVIVSFHINIALHQLQAD